jgi:hypothetical protein
MLEDLMQTLPQHRNAELRQQLKLLDRTIEGHYPFPEDLALARIPDPQGLGGVRRASRNRGDNRRRREKRQVRANLSFMDVSAIFRATRVYAEISCISRDCREIDSSMTSRNSFDI